MVCNDEEYAKSRRPSAEDRGWSHRSGTRWSGDREVRWRRVWSAPCTWRRGAQVSWLSLRTKVTVCEWFGLKTTQTVFAGLASKPVATVSGSLASKPAATVSSGLASKPVVMIFHSLASKLVAMVSSGLASKPTVGFLVQPQNQGGGGFPGLGLKTGSSGLVIWASASPRRFLGLGLKTKWASVCRLRQKTDGGRSARHTCRDLVACFAWKQVSLGFPSLT
jgi:hypothetical protein